MYPKEFHHPQESLLKKVTSFGPFFRAIISSCISEPMKETIQIIGVNMVDAVFLVSAVFFCTLDAGLLARSQYSEGPATGHLDTGFSWFPVSISKCSDGSQHSQLPLHASHVALPT